MRRSPMTLKTLAVLVVVGVIAGFVTRAGVASVIVAVLVGWLIAKVGYMALAGLGRPVPEPPPPGELRKVRLTFRCSICGTEVRMTSANDDVPEPPRHCQEDMDFVAPLYE